MSVDTGAATREHRPMLDSPNADAQTRSHDSRVAWSVAALIAGTVLVGALVPGSAGHRVPASPKDDAACAEWGDGCHVCRRTEEGVACSLPGIACVPKAPSCQRRVDG